MMRFRRTSTAECWIRIAMFALVGLVLATVAIARDEEGQTPVEREQALLEQLEEAPNDADLHYRLANALYDQGRREKAIASYERALAVEPDHVKALVNLGVVLNENGDSEAALKRFDRAEELEPTDVTVLCNKGQALYALERYGEAIDLYQKAKKLEPNNQLPYYLMGVAFADVGIYREAIREWEKVVALDPSTEAAETAAESIKVLRQLVPAGSE
ncbi:MAG: tetratricopeptide repeat protein [Candidatus Eisenbacteria bacterium]|nr:tetratricopeptide repeat protein [Candidatus Latescibacterota bacterium]MBD3301366.1 tetratricopeptide repeat protein [Candidatus Eisenbacteria bacterium]